MPNDPHRWLRQLSLLGAGAALSACGGLPPAGNRTVTTALQGNERTSLGSMVRPKVAAHPGLCGLHPLTDGREALAARLALADAAQRTLDVQYFIWSRDLAGKLLVERLLRAADRGVRVRLLLDDLGTMPTDKVLLAIDSHPNVEVRMFNPLGMRSLRLVGLLGDFERMNKRMHNKSFTADSQVSIVGGRNIADSYFGASEGANYADLDVAVVGPAVREVSSNFDLYWNHRAAIPIAALAPQETKPEELAAKRAEISALPKTAENAPYLESVRTSPFARQLRSRSVTWTWARSGIISDHPDKVLTASSETTTHIAPKLLKVIDATKKELFLISPYFVPGKEGVELLRRVRQRGVRVVVVTNSLASTDGIAAHSGYQPYRKSLLEAGIELYEMKPTAASGERRQRTSSSGGLAGSGGGLGGSSGAGAGSSGASLHAKTFSFDRRIGFIGSYNIDPRSSKLNTEMGVMFESTTLARRMPESVERDLATSAYKVGLEGDKLVWVTREGGKEVRFDSEPGADFSKRFKSSVLKLLPIEGLL